MRAVFTFTLAVSAACARYLIATVMEEMMSKGAVVLALALAGIGLAGCGPEHDPHYLPTWLTPGNSPGVMAYSTNPYAAPNAPSPAATGAGAFP